MSRWRKSGFCASGECIEWLARAWPRLPGREPKVLLRNSQRPRQAIRATPRQLADFLAGYQAGELGTGPADDL